MCQYSTDEGCRTLAPRAPGQPRRRRRALVFTEATAVARDGRISPETRASGTTPRSSRWSDRPIHRRPRCRRRYPARARRPQGRHRRAVARGGRLAIADGGWQPVAPSAIPFAEGDPAPTALDEAGSARSSRLPRAAARPLARRVSRGRDPRRARLPAARVPLPADEHAHRRLRRQLREPDPAAARGRRRGSRGVARRAAPVVRISATDWVEGGWDIDQSVELSRCSRRAAST